MEPALGNVALAPPQREAATPATRSGLGRSLLLPTAGPVFLPATSSCCSRLYSRGWSTCRTQQAETQEEAERTEKSMGLTVSHLGLNRR